MTSDPKRVPDDKALKWGVIDGLDTAVFAYTDVVDDLCRLRAAISAASTWGEFRAQAPDLYVEEVHELIGEVPADDSTFDPGVIPGFGDGDWPEWLQQEMLDWMPRDLIERYGSVEDSALNGRALEIAPGVGDDVARELATLGFACTRDDEAVALASGWG